jgi:hypothetical protein
VPKQIRENPTSAVFQIGDKVRVRHGVRDSDYPDMPLGGWKGQVVEVHKDCIYTVEWTKETLSSIHPVFPTADWSMIIPIGSTTGGSFV